MKQTQDQPIIGAVNNRLRMKLFGTINDWMSVNLAYDFSSRVQDRSLFEKQFLDLGFTPRGYRAKDLDSQLYPGSDDSVSSLAIFQNLDRLYLTINGKWADLYLGRQAIAWGSAHLINPTDILVPYAFNQLDVEDRTGVDAFRIRIPAGLMGEIDAGYVFGEDLKYKNSALFLRGRFYYHRTDITAMGIVFQKNLLFGLDLARSLGGAGFWLEGGYVLANALDSQRHNDEEDYLRISIGMDYVLADGTYLFGEYHFNQAGACEPENHLSLLEKTAYRQGSVYLFGRHYLVPGISYQITPLFILNGEMLINLTDPSVFLMPQVEYNIAQDIYLSAGAYFGLGEKPDAVTYDDQKTTVKLRSEFGGYPDLYFTSFRIYF